MDYTFANFVVGASNQFAHAAAFAVATRPTSAYIPLFISGGPGLGKTHLLQAIRHSMTQADPTRQVLYLPAERFAQDLSSALLRHTIEDFRQQYRQVDVLLLDNVQCLAGKTHTQEEFIHTFNVLYEAGKPIVLGGDRPPQRLTLFQERLRSRFSNGVLADIYPPDLETRLAILLSKAEAHGFLLPTEVAWSIATHCQSNVRELEHCLVRMATYASLHTQPLSVGLAETVLQQIRTEQDRIITAARIQQAVAAYFKIKAGALRSKSRQRSITFPRHVAMFLCRELTNASLAEIGQAFGGKDHTTVLHSCVKIARLEEHDEQVARILWQLRQRLEN